MKPDQWVILFGSWTISAPVTKRFSIVSGFEHRLKKTGTGKDRSCRVVRKRCHPKGAAEGLYRTIVEFPVKSLEAYENRSYAVRQTVLRLAFLQPFKFTPEGMYETAKTALPVRVLGGVSGK